MPATPVLLQPRGLFIPSVRLPRSHVLSGQRQRRQWRAARPLAELGGPGSRNTWAPANHSGLMPEKFARSH
eukprot:11656129-Alexandrium_andersonii.AAC.1